MSVEVRKRGGRLTLLAALTLAGCGLQDTDEAGKVPTSGRVLNVEVAAVEPRDFSEVIRLSGTVVADRDVLVSAEESGIVTEVLVDKGSQVIQGQPIARIDDRLLSSQVAQATAQAALMGEVWMRRQRLFEEDNVGSELAYLEAKYQAQQAAAALGIQLCCCVGCCLVHGPVISSSVRFSGWSWTGVGFLVLSGKEIVVGSEFRRR